MENKSKRLKSMFDQYTWRINNFSKLDSKILYSQKFFLDQHTWRIFIYPKGNNDNYLSIYLVAGADGASLFEGWNKFANFKLALINQINDQKTIIKGSEYLFNANRISWGFKQFASLDEFWDPNSGFIVNDTCIIEVGIFVSKLEHENQVGCPVSNITESTTNPLPREIFTTPFGVLVDFRGLGKIEQAFVPLLEDVCTQHPSLIDCQQKKSRRYIEWAFTALGAVLHFLKTKKVKDMDDDAYNHLQNLWDELQTFRFDLTWLEPNVKFALSMKNHIKKAALVKKMKENVATLEMQTETLKAKIKEAEVKLEIARKDLKKVEEGFKECNLDAELGYEG